MKYKEVLEKVHFHFPSKYSPIDEVMVYKNPNNREFTQLMSRLPYKELRGITNNHVVYVWDANLAVHDEIIELIDNKVDIGKFMVDGDKIYTADEVKDNEYFRNHDMIKRMMGTL